MNAQSERHTATARERAMELREAYDYTRWRALQQATRYLFVASVIINAGVLFRQFAGGSVWQGARSLAPIAGFWALAFVPRSYKFSDSGIRGAPFWSLSRHKIPAREIAGWRPEEWRGLPAIRLTLRNRRQLLLCYDSPVHGSRAEREVYRWLDRAVEGSRRDRS